MAQRFAPTDSLAMDSGTAQSSTLPQPALPGPSQLTTAEMDVLIGVQRSIPRPPSGHVAQHVTSRQVTRQTTQGSTSITETFTEVIVDLWTELDPSQRDRATRQATQVDPMSEAHWTEAMDPSGGEMCQQVQHSSTARCQDSHYQNVTSQRSTRRTRTDDQLSSVEMEILTGGDSPQYRGQHRSAPALPESRSLPGYSPCLSKHHSLPSTDSSPGMDTRRRSQNMSFQTGPRSSHFADALSRDEKPRHKQENMPVCLPTRSTSRSYNANQSDELALVPLVSFLGTDSSQQRKKNRFSQHQFGLSEQIDVTGPTPDQIDPLLGNHTRRSSDRYQPSQFNRPPPCRLISRAPTNISGVDASQFSRTPPSHPITSAPTNISTGIDVSQFSRPPPSYSISSVPTNNSTGIDASQFSRPPPSYPTSSASTNISTVTGVSQFNRPPPYYPPSSAPTNISTGIESQGQYSAPSSTLTNTVQMPKPMPYPSTFERNPSTRVPARSQSQYAPASHPTHIRTTQANPPETFLPTTIKVELQEQEDCQHTSSQINPQLGPCDVFNPSAFSQLPTSMEASVAETRSQYISEPSGRSAQTSHANLSDPIDPFSLAEMDIFTGAETSRYQGQFISAPLLTEHQTQQSNLPNPLTYPFLGATMDTPEVQITGQVENISSPPFSETNLIKIEPNNQSTTIDSSLVIDLDEDSNGMPYQRFDIPTQPLPEVSPQTLQSDLPNLNAYPSLAAAIETLAEMEIAGRQNQYEPGYRPSRANMLATCDYTSGSEVEIPQLQSFNPMSNQFNRGSTSSSLGMPLHPSPNIRTPVRPPESERQRVARLLREFLKNSSK